jgi:hypothetical protein
VPFLEPDVLVGQGVVTREEEVAEDAEQVEVDESRSVFE